MDHHPSRTNTRIVGALLLAWSLSAIAVETTYEAAINIAGQQRMWSQKLVMEYCQIGLGVFPAEGRKTLHEGTRQFEQNLERLEKVAKSHPEIGDAVADLRLVWGRFQPLLREPPTLERARQLNYISEDLLYVANKTVILLQDLSNRPVDRLVNLAGQQRMLSQRLAKLYLLESWGLNTLSVRDDLNRGRREFSVALEVLRTAPENSPDIAGELDEVILQWEWFRGALSRPDHARFRLVVVDASETILRTMERVTAWYELMATSLPWPK
jgi:hypothetical protein